MEDARFIAKLSNEHDFNASLSESTGDRFNAKTQFIGSLDYSGLVNKPLIEGVILVGDRSFEELGLDFASYEDISNLFG